MPPEGCELHIDLRVDEQGRLQPVPVRQVGDDLYEVLFTPGFVDGIAAGDTICVSDRSSGQFEVVRRGGNLAIKIFSRVELTPLLAWLQPQLEAMGGRLDGRLDRAAALTVPVGATLQAVEAVMAEAVRVQPSIEWYFANVYDDDGAPLSWWR